LRSHLNRSPLQRLLSDGCGVDSASASGPDLAERWGAWLTVADAIALRTGLQSVASAKVSAAPQTAQPVPLADELARVRAALTKAIAALSAAPHQQGRGGAGHSRAPGGAAHPLPSLGLDPATEFTLLHQRYNDHQRRMELSVSALRNHARQVLSSSSPALAQLAALDAVMEQLLGAREQNLLSTIPVFLRRRFERRRSQVSETEALEAHPQPSAERTLQPPAWLSQLNTEFQQALLAELDLRLQPVAGMVQAHVNAVLEAQRHASDAVQASPTGATPPRKTD
jgi:hypothetical protein